MITKQTAANNEAYLARFEAIGEAVWGDSERINSLEEYFANIEEIATFALNHPEYTGLCLAMPVDEPTFDIDANTRVITVPDVFKKNGIAVLGDHAAETIYFAIDKYFDYQSFAAENINVRINWAFVEAGKKVAVDKLDVKTVRAFGPSENLIPGKLVFGWTITKAMTTGAGTLLFSVELYSTDVTGNIDYSFNTLTAQISVGNALQLKDPTTIPVDDSAILLNRLRNTPYRVDAIEGPAQPIWLTADGDGLPATANMPFENDDTQSTLTLRVQAGINRGKTIQYVWESSLANGGLQPNVVNGNGDEYMATESLAAEDGVLYYVKVSEHPDTYRLLTGDDKTAAFAALAEYAALTPEAQAEAEVPATVYERFNTFNVNGAGVYKVRANAKVDISDETAEELTPEQLASLEAVTKYVESETCVVPAATAPVVELDVTSQVSNVTLIDDTVDTYTYIDNNSAPGIVVALRREDADKLGALSVVMLDADGKIKDTDVVFDELTDADFVADAASNDPVYDFARYADNITIDSGLTAQGEYRVGVINRLNNTYAKGTSDSIITSFVAPVVTNIGLEATYSGSETSVSVLENGAQPGGNEVYVDLNNISALLLVPATISAVDFPGCTCSYRLQEVVYNDETNAWDVATADNTNPPDDVNNDFEIGENSEAASNFIPLNRLDNGWYRIKTITEYNNTRSIGYTETFRCIV